MKKYYIITLLVLTFSCLFSIIPEVSEIAITSNSENVIINYDLDADGQCQVVLVASDDAGATFRIYPTNLTGDVGNYVSPGDSKQITWDYTQDNIEAGDNFQIKLIARDNPYPAEDNNNFLSFTKVEGGTFHNGTADVTLSTFFMDKFETTQGEYEAVVGTNPSHHSGASKPVELTSWFDALIYCNKRSLQEGLIPCYNYSNQGLDPYEWSVDNLSASAFSFDFEANGYRLPTEMEWMFAAKGGTEQPATGYNLWPGTDNTEDLGDYAWGSFNAGFETHPVATKLPNQLYLYDMAGNVREWCWDLYDIYDSDAQTNPIGPNAGYARITRGGDFGIDANSLNLTSRYPDHDYLNFLSIGFRSVRRMEETSLEVTPTPIISPEAGTYNSAQEITISSGFGRSNIYYSLDGSYPDLNSTHYTGPFTVSETTTVKARAYRDEYQPSEVLTAEYEITIMPENFILVESGTFHNGVGDITLSSFYMDKYEITQAEYESVVGTNPSSFLGTNNPVEQVSWFDAIKYCNLRSMQKGLTPCYNYNEEGTDPNSWSDGWNLVNNQVWYSCDFSADGYRLPTEMEWMYAAKGGKLTNEVTYSSWSGTNDLSQLGDYAWYWSNATSTTHHVGTKEPNELGLYDMSGNVLEWCWDMYEDYNPEAQTNPEGSVSNVSRIYRGGSWLSGPINCKVTVRWRLNPPDESQNFLGFRVVRRLDNTLPEVTPTPSITPEAGSYSAEQTIELSLSGTNRPAIYYTLDGSYPNLTSDQYRFPFTLSDTTTVKAMAYIDGYQPSEVLNAEYDIGLPGPEEPEDFDYIEGGTFYNGTSDVAVGSFSLSKYELTQAEYVSVVGTNPSSFTGDNNPVEQVSWFDAIKYCNLRSIRDGLTPCYEYNNEGTNPANWSAGWDSNANHTLYSCDFSALGYRLPTEMEWLYAAKGGIQSAAIGFNQFAGTDNPSYLNTYAWYNSNSQGTSRPVATRQANQLQLYDMSGNIDEWCWDIYGAFSNEAQIDPTGPSTGNNRVSHGGSWDSNQAGCLLARRTYSQPSVSSEFKGIRLARSIEASELEVTQNPIISPVSGSYEYGQRITMSAGEGFPKIYYTLDGTLPNLSSILYDGPFSLSESVTIKARAYRNGMQSSDFVSSEYQIGELSNNFIYVEGGTFNNGTANVTLSPFYMNKYELTEGEYEALMGVTPSHSYGDGADYPILLVSWVKALKYCNLRSMDEGLTPCYEYGDDGTNPANWSDGWNTYTNHTLYTCDFSANGYRLPTEMEWMYAAKGGNLTPATGYGDYATDANYVGGYFGNQDYMWNSNNNEPNGAKPVGTKLPNYLGLYDMSGNVFEFCWDIYGEYNSGSQTNPIGPDTGTERIIRGGSWNSANTICLLTNRESINPTDSHINTGFRLVQGTGFDPAEVTPNPVISPEAGLYEGDQTISLTCETDQAEIYYTLDGSNPDSNSTLYSGPFVISHATIVRARAYSDGYQPSGLVVADYVIIPENFIFVEGGSLHNGTTLAILSDFYIGKYEVTQAEYEEVVGTNPSNYSGSNKPVEQVTWYDAVLYCNAKSTQEGLTPCYNTYTWSCNFDANGYRLPTEMEWMYAAKGGYGTHYSNYDQYAGTDLESQLHNYAVYSIGSTSSRFGTQVVGSKLPNELGLYDMSGNVWEWCNDWYGEYNTSYQIDPVGPESGEHRVFRGGAHLWGAYSCRVASRSQDLPSYSHWDTGFRVVRRIN